MYEVVTPLGARPYGQTGGVDPPQVPSPAELERLGLYDPRAPDAGERLELVTFLLQNGATLDELRRAPNPGVLAVGLILRHPGKSTLAEVVQATGVDFDQARRLLSSPGHMADPGERLTEGEVTAISVLTGSSNNLLGAEATTHLARVAVSTMARMAETIVSSFRVNFELPRLLAGVRELELVRQYAEVARDILPEFTVALDALLRRQIIGFGSQMWSTDEDRAAVTLLRTVGFADLVGYTSASASMSVRELTAILAQFEETTAEAVYRGNGQIVKTIGDEAMFVAEDAVDACRIAVDLTKHVAQAGLPPIRVGLAAGEVVSIGGDVFGPTVNLAARLVETAEPSRVVVSEPVREASLDKFSFDPLAPLTLKGFEVPVVAFALKP
jgi:adenylate cyclase